MIEQDQCNRLFGIGTPWRVMELDTDHRDQIVRVYVAHDPDQELVCPQCGTVCPGYDKRRRQWRHLDTCQYRTIVVSEVPRVACPEHGVVTVSVPWAKPLSRFTVLFEVLVIAWLKEASTSAVGRLMGLSWTAIDGIMQCAVQRGLSRRQDQVSAHIGVDETAHRKRHDYVTIVSDQQTGTVLHVGEDRRKETLGNWYRNLSPAQLAGLESVSMDMWPAYINATLEHVPGAREKIAFDKFHVAKCLGDAVNKVRRQEHRALMKQGCETLKGSRYDWLTNLDNMSYLQKARFQALRHSTLKTARAWALKETAMSQWHYVSRTWARKGWERWLSWAMRCRLEPVRQAAGTIRNHLWGILNAIVLKVTNGPAEGINSRIKMIKVRSRGFRNKQRFANAIYFHLGGLDLQPNTVNR